MKRTHLFVLFALAGFAGPAFADFGSLFMAILPSLFAGAASGLIGSLFGGGNKPSDQQAAPTPPPVEAPTPMPAPDDAAVQEAKRRSVFAQMQRSGRASTILTGDNGTGDRMGA